MAERFGVDIETRRARHKSAALSYDSYAIGWLTNDQVGHLENGDYRKADDLKARKYDEANFVHGATLLGPTVYHVLKSCNNDICDMLPLAYIPINGAAPVIKQGERP
jgi:hypothetical protein